MGKRQQGSASNLRKTHAFYRDANKILRIAIILALAWPMFAVLASVYLSPKNAESIVTLIGLSIIVPVVAFIVGNPFQYFLYVQDPDIRTGARWIAALVGAELSLAIYLYIVPIRDDPRLVPLLILAAFALFFFSLAQMVSWLRVLLVALLLGITIVFILGGRAKIRAAFKQEQAAIEKERAATPKEHPSPVNVRSTEHSPAPRLAQVSAQPVAAVNPDAPCPGTENRSLNFSNAGPGPINVSNYPSNCFGLEIILPESYKATGWCAEPYSESDPNHTLGLDPDPTHTWTIAILSVNTGRIYGPVHWSNRPQDDLRLINPPVTFRLRGNHEPGGGTTFYPYPRDGSGCAQPRWPSQGPTSNGSETPDGPLRSGPVAVQASDHGYTFAFWPCRVVNSVARCEGFAEQAKLEAGPRILLSAVKDDDGNVYQPQSFSVAGNACRNMECLLNDGDIGTESSLTVQENGIVAGVRSLTLTFVLSNRFPLPTMFARQVPLSITIPISGAP